jgi:CTP:molybdopterin cytidylyltransferase MocA
MKTGGLVLAAGLSSRMGDFKPLMEINGKPLIEHSIESLLRGGAETVTVVLGYRAEDIKARLSQTFSKKQISFALNADFETTDMLASIKTGLSAISPCDAFFLLPGDMPAVHQNTMAELTSALVRSGAHIAIPTIKGRRKHPPLIRSSCIKDILSYQGKEGLRGFWHTYEQHITEAAVLDKGCLMDADKMDDFIVLSRYLKNKKCLT